MSWWRRTPSPAHRHPHPDGRVEMELQRVLALFAATRRIEGRLEDIRVEQQRIDRLRRENAGYANYVQAHTEHAADLRDERAGLEKEIAALHDEAGRRLADLGDDAVYLGEIPS